ncbi:protein phosphatase 2C domain-containing protein [Massilia sp. R2A-15]|uniref:protein phosphatase 2C domain-containing protein n=1 Tax=Massilia sp. R2A-15 TaxID=3064278 RepID=UPI0027334AE3|nr:protein phosphatase 2C domain-containing protein [Massilia sp. R2A-15]WLI89391.1 protein phosphatase 2C domain-containing protein [Massilia sp. R2A-15]
MKKLFVPVSASTAAGLLNEDLVAIFHHSSFTDIVVMDGASSVADQAYIDVDGSDAAWFVGAFARSLADFIGEDRPQRDSVLAALDHVAAGFRSRMAGSEMPLHAYPIAALTWVRVRPGGGGGATLELYFLGDCKTLLRHADGRVEDLDAWVNPQEAILRDEIARLAGEGVHDPACRRARLLPMLRQRREYQNTCTAPASLCLEPRGQFDARESTVHVAPGAALLVMTDGFYRLVDTYKCDSPASLMQQCIDDGVDAVMRKLRCFEAAGASANGVVKSQDDASAVLCRFDV